MSSKVYVGNINPNADGTDVHTALQDTFQQFGKIRNIWVARKPPGFAFVTFESDRDAADAVSKSNSLEILGQNVTIEVSTNDSRGNRNGGDARRDNHRGGRGSDFRVRLTGLPDGIDWRDLKDFLRESVAEPMSVNTVGGGEAVADFRSSEDVDRVVSRLDDTKFKGTYIRVSRESFSGGRDRERHRDDFDRRRDYDRHGGDRDYGRDRHRDRFGDRSRSRSLGRGRGARSRSREPAYRR